jgi:hypothetical protein
LPSGANGRPEGDVFVQLLTGAVANATALRRQFDRWAIDLTDGASGFLDVTAGITPDGTFVAAARFEDASQARHNSWRPEQASWWRETAPCFRGDVVFRESEDIEYLGPGRSGTAGFVQVIEGRTSDRRRFMELEREIEKGFTTERPDFLGSFLAWWRDGTWVEVACFRSEAETRTAEQNGLSRELQDVFMDWQCLAAPSSYLDISDPWLVG